MSTDRIDVDQVASYIDDCSPQSGVFLGCDSERYRLDGVWWIDYYLVVVIHLDGKHGCKIFGEVQTERDQSWIPANKPKMRLLNETYKVADLYNRLSALTAHDIAIHLDINPNEMHGSNVAVQEAVGYIKGVCGITPEVKPSAFAASYAADRWKEVAGRRRIPWEPPSRLKVAN